MEYFHRMFTFEYGQRYTKKIFERYLNLSDIEIIMFNISVNIPFMSVLGLLKEQRSKYMRYLCF